MNGEETDPKLKSKFVIQRVPEKQPATDTESETSLGKELASSVIKKGKSRTSMTTWEEERDQRTQTLRNRTFFENWIESNEEEAKRLKIDKKKLIGTKNRN